jgi:hypothetical protein
VNASLTFVSATMRSTGRSKYLPPNTQQREYPEAFAGAQQRLRHVLLYAAEQRQDCEHRHHAMS